MNNNKISFFYHLQIPKNGGTYINNFIVNNIKDKLKNNNITVIDGVDHHGWIAPDNSYIISSLRDPVKRTVSHYAYLGDTFFGKINLDISIEDHIKNMFKWMEENAYINNYQTKNLIYVKKDMSLSIFDPIGQINFDNSFLNIIPTLDIGTNKLKNINILLKDIQLKSYNIDLILQKIGQDLTIPNITNYIKSDSYDNNVNILSYYIYEKLTKKQIQYIYEQNQIDSELYFSDHLYWNKGE